MRVVIQRAREASVAVGEEITASLPFGIVALVGFERGDAFAAGQQMIDRLLKLRIFADERDRMNLSLVQAGGGLLLISQFTLAGSTARGLRPSFDGAMPPAEAERLFEEVAAYARSRCPVVLTGRFGAHMRVRLLNDGPVTFVLDF